MAILTAGGFLRRGRRRAVRVHHFHFCPFGQTIDTVSNHPVTADSPAVITTFRLSEYPA